MHLADDEKAQVRAYWEREPCGSNFADSPAGTAGFYDEVERHRYRVEPHIHRFAGFDSARGQRVLEIGVGLGTDFIQFARHGAELCGVDLTEAAIANVRARLAQEGLSAALHVADAEALPFADASFDRVYSWGVLHHTPNTEKAVLEALRVLRPGGEVCVMMYHRHSWVVYGHWVKFALLRRRPWQGLDAVIANHVESTGTKAYRRRDLRRMFAGLDGLRVQIVPTAYDRRFAGPLATATGRWLGWNAVVRGRKAVAPLS